MTTVRVIDGDGKSLVDAFYEVEGKSQRVDFAERFVVAEDSGHVVGVARLCDEHGHLVLRTMYLRQEYRGEGLGGLMLKRFASLLEGRDCYCLPFEDLIDFYGQVGFVPIQPGEAPSHLRERLQENRGNGQNVLIMWRLADPVPQA